MSVFAVIVTYEPELELLDTLVRTLMPQVAGALVVDNGSRIDVAAWYRRAAHDRLQLRLLPENLGIAAAQNVGIEAARSSGAEFVLLSDQDSEPARDMVAQLLSAARRLTEEGTRVAAVGPRYLDVNQNLFQPFQRTTGLRLRYETCPDARAVLPVDYVIASGCVIPLAALAAVGGMREEIFIDYVDVEWGLRAQQRGFQSFGVCGATMRHRHGDRPIAFLGRRYLVHSPLRHYYRFRNAVWLYKQRHVPLSWKIVDGLRLARRYFFYALVARPQLSHWRMMTLGLCHGLRSRLGRLDAPGSERRTS